MEQKYNENGYMKMFKEVLEEKEQRYQSRKTAKSKEDKEDTQVQSQLLIDHLYSHRDEMSLEEITDELKSLIIGVS
jgi:protein subunit release factor B